MKKKNLLIFYPSFERGGVEENIKNLINNFSEKINIHLISSISRNKANSIFRKKIKIYSIKKKKFLFFLPSRINFAISATTVFFKLISKLKKKNLIIHSMQSNVVAILVCIIQRVKIVIRNSEDPIYSTFYSEKKIISYIIFLSKIIFYNFCSSIITNSKGSKNSLEKFVFNKNNIKTIYNPYLKKINSQRYKKKDFIVNVGRFRKQKNQILLVRSFQEFLKKNKNFKLVLVGDGVLRRNIENEIQNLNLNEHVILKGWVNDPLKYIKKSKLFVLTSLYEGLGNVLIDAINHDVPCISTSCKSGPNEILLNGKGGYILKNNNAAELSKTMSYCIKNYDKAKKKNKISKLFLKRFLMKDRVKEYENFLIKFENN